MELIFFLFSFIGWTTRERGTKNVKRTITVTSQDENWPERNFGRVSGAPGPNFQPTIFLSLASLQVETSQFFKTQQRAFWLRQLCSHVSRELPYLQLLVVSESLLRLAPFPLFAFEDLVWSERKKGRTNNDLNKSERNLLLHWSDIRVSLVCPVELSVLNTLELRSFNQPRGTTIGSKNRKVRKLEGKFLLKFFAKGPKKCFKQSGGSNDRGFEKSRFYCIICNTLY